MKKNILIFGICGLSYGAVVAQTQPNLIPNGNFEGWTTSTYYIPQNFIQCSNPQALSDSLPLNVIRTTDKYHGNYAIELTTEVSTNGGNDTVPGYFININPNNGNNPNSWHGGFPYTQKPTGIRGWFKYNVATNDSATILVAFSKGGKNIRTYKYQIGGVKNNYTLFDTTFNPPLSSLGLGNNNVSALQADTKGDVWVGTNGGGILKYDGTHWTTYTTVNGLGSDTIHSIAIDANTGNVWVGTTQGLSTFNGSNWTNYTTSNGLAFNDVRGLQIGTNDSVWAGTYGGGVSQLNGSTWTTYTTSNGLINNDVRPVRIDSHNNKWFGTKSGVSKLSGTAWTSYTTANGLANNDVRSIQQDKHGNLWFGTNGSGVSKYNGSTWVTFTTAQGLVNNYVNKIFVDSKNNLWFGTNAGISVFDSTTANWTTYTISNGLIGDSIQGFTMDSKGNIWVGTPEGISIYNGSSWASITTTSSTTPDSVIFAALSCKFGGNGSPTGPPGSTLKLDNVSFTGAASQPTLFDGNFEAWDSTTINIPNDWYISNSGGNIVGFDRTTDVPTGGGSYAIELTTYLGNQHNHAAAQAGQVSKGYNIKNCNNKCQEQGGIPYTKQIDTLAFYYKYAPSGNDSGRIQLTFIKADTTIINGIYGINLHASSSYQYKEIPFNLSQKPDSVIIDLQSSAWNDTVLSFIGSDLKVDNIHFKSQHDSHTQSPDICEGKSLPVGTKTYSVSGTYIDTVSSYQGYDSIITSNLTILTNCPTAITTYSEEVDVKIYPNPVITIATLEIGSQVSIKGALLQIIDVYGKTVKKISINSYTTTFDTSDLTSGVYFYQLITADGILKPGKIIVN